jgi:hypothetical protein
MSIIEIEEELQCAKENLISAEWEEEHGEGSYTEVTTAHSAVIRWTEELERVKNEI